MAKAARSRRKGGTRRLTKAERIERQKQKRALRWRLTVVVVLLAVLSAVVFFTRDDDEAAVIAALEANGACTYDRVTDEDPPAKGDVADVEPADAGFYEPGDETPSDLALLRAMRQGFVVLWYEPDTPADDYRAVSDRLGRDLIVVPRPGLPTPTAVTAWGRRLLCSSFDEDAVVMFAEAFRDAAPEKGFL